MWTLFEYFIPENPIAQVIVFVLWGLFALWLAALIAAALKLKSHSAAIRKLIGLVPRLAAVREAFNAKRARGESLDRIPSDDFRELLPVGLSSRDAVVRHVEAIYIAGCQESRLDTAELLRHTERSIADGDTSRRIFLNIFLIIGLLGTLFGLADSILQLLAQLRNSGDAASNLAALLGALKGAFAPSISGVLTSVLGTIAYALYQRVFLASLVNDLREATLNLWIPELYPTTSQRAVEAAQRSLDAAAKVTEASQFIREDTEKLAVTLKAAVRDTVSYGQAMRELSGSLQSFVKPTTIALDSFSLQLDRFHQAMERWTAFEMTLKELYLKMGATQGALLVQSALIGTAVDNQSAELRSMAASLKTANGEVFEKVCEAFKDIQERMSSLQVPFKDAAQQMLDQAQILKMFSENVITSYDETMQDIRGELKEGNDRSTVIERKLDAYAQNQSGNGKEPQSNIARFEKAIQDQLAVLREISDKVTPHATSQAPNRPTGSNGKDRPSDGPSAPKTSPQPVTVVVRSLTVVEDGLPSPSTIPPPQPPKPQYQPPQPPPPKQPLWRSLFWGRP